MCNNKYVSDDNGRVDMFAEIVIILTVLLLGETVCCSELMQFSNISQCQI